MSQDRYGQNEDTAERRAVGCGRKHAGEPRSQPAVRSRVSEEDTSMADSTQLRRLVAYNQWANEKILRAIDGMTAEDLARPVDAYFGTIGGNLHHVLWA